jgi:hypothetical protein
LTGAALGAGTKLLVDKVSAGTKQLGDKISAAVKPASKAVPNISAPPVSMAQKAAAAKKVPTSVVTPPATGGTLSDEEVQSELDRVTGDKEQFTPPKDALVDLNNGTYTVYKDGINYTYSASDGSLVGAEQAPIDEEGAFPSTGPQQFFEDEYGNTYERQEDGSYSMVTENVDGVFPSTEPERYWEDENGLFYERQADGSYSLISTQEDELPPDTQEDYLNTPYTSDAYYTDEYGNTFQKQDDGSYEFMFGNDDNTNEQTSFDQSVQNDPMYWLTVDDPEAYNYYTSDDYYSQFDDFRNGGLITMMKQGGIAKYAPGGRVDQGDGTYLENGAVYDSVTDDYLYSINYDTGAVDDINQSYVYSPQEKVSTGASSFGQSEVRASNAPWPAGYVPNGDGTATKVYSDGSTSTIDENENIIDTTGADENAVQFAAGSGDRPWYSDLGSTLQKGLTGATKLGGSALNSITGALGTTAGAAGAGALLATLLGQNFSGGSDSQNQGLDMSKVGMINPRTTDFGIGPSRFVGYEDYGTGGGEYAPNEELLRNLNAPGFNPVNEGDYGYETPAATTEAPKMASGGLSSMSTPVASYYTFGQPADILANLGMRPQPPQNPPEMNAQVGQQQPPQQAQQQGLPQQMPPQMAQQTPQGMPQQGMMPQQQGMPPPMRKGGLPHVSNVPLVQGRMDFRNGSAVHGEGDGQSDDIPAMLADGEYVIDAETVAQIGNGSTKAGAQALDKFRENIRSHKRSAPVNKIPPKTKALTSYLKGVK